MDSLPGSVRQAQRCRSHLRGAKLQAGLQNRRVNAHALNRESSRTHALLGAQTELRVNSQGSVEGPFLSLHLAPSAREPHQIRNAITGRRRCYGVSCGVLVRFTLHIDSEQAPLYRLDSGPPAISCAGCGGKQSAGSGVRGIVSKDKVCPLHKSKDWSREMQQS